MSAIAMDVRVAIAEEKIKQVVQDVSDVKGDIRDIKRSQRTILFMLVGSLTTLATSSVLLLVNLAK